MAEAVIISIAGKIIGILSSKAIETVEKSCNVKDELNTLKDTLSILRPVVDHAEEQYHQDPRIQAWVDKLKDALYEVQDVLEEFNIEDMRRELRGHNEMMNLNEMMKEVMTFFSSSNQLVFNWKMSDKVRALKVRIEAIEAKRPSCLENRPKREWINREETHSFIRDIKGREDDKKKVMKFLRDSNVEENISILPIVGIGGLGKTALAKYVYGESEFDLKMWVCVSTNFDQKKILKQMLACVEKKEQTEDMMELLQSNLREKIYGKKYLLVLDDVWDIEYATWDNFKTLLVEGSRGSKILVTTRLSSVEKIMVTAPPHHLEGLSESASLDLLMQMVGKNLKEIKDFDMLAIGKEIVRKCSGVPLVIRTVGHILSSKKTGREWLRFKDDELPEVSKSDKSIKSVLKLSYDHLPSHLKQCFVLCSLFPKDYEIKKQTLVDLWMAEGFIQPLDRGQHLEDIAHGYFMDLLWSNFFQDFKKDPYTNEETCKMHDLMHDLACLVAWNECSLARDNTEVIHERTRHISYGPTFHSMGKLSISHSKPSALRTFLSIRIWEETEPRESTSEADLHRLIQNFERLRILDLHGAKVERVPWSICKLKHLTYLDLSYNRTLKRLPNSITRLQSLQTLNLYWCYALEELPSDIRKLVSLRNLDIDGCSKLSYLPRGLGELSYLHRLTCFILPKDEARAKNYCGLGELKELNDIRGSLSIENLRYVTNAEIECRNANLMRKSSLESLSLSWSNFNIDDNNDNNDNSDKVLLDELKPPSNLQELSIWNYKGESFSMWMMESLMDFLPHLVKVWLGNCKRCKCLPPLDQLPCLKLLFISDMPELEYIGPEQSSPSTSSFPSLSILSVSRCDKLEAMPLTPDLEELDLVQSNSALLINQMLGKGLNKLKRLAIVSVKFLKCLPEEGFQSLTSLKSLQIISCHQLTSLSLGMRHLSSLERLCIRECNELDISKDESDNILNFHGLHNLRSVEFWRLPKLTFFPQWLLQACNLERLEISDCESLKDIPEQIEGLQSLQNLYIMGCSSLTSLPEAMRRLTSLTHLTICHCRELQESCKRQPGKDKIAHIPNIEF